MPGSNTWEDPLGKKRLGGGGLELQAIGTCFSAVLLCALPLYGFTSVWFCDEVLLSPPRASVLYCYFSPPCPTSASAQDRTGRGFCLETAEEQDMGGWTRRREWEKVYLQFSPWVATTLAEAGAEAEGRCAGPLWARGVSMALDDASARSPSARVAGAGACFRENFTRSWFFYLYAVLGFCFVSFLIFFFY